MKFTPKSTDEIAESGLLPDGDYDFEVSKAEEATSKAGNEMLTLDLKVFNGDGSFRTVRDYLVSSDGGLRKIRGFAASVGLLDHYEQGDFGPFDILNAAGRCKIGKDANPGYEPKNKVAYYLDPSKAKSGVVSAPTVRQPARKPAPAGAGGFNPGDLDDDIPF